MRTSKTLWIRRLRQWKRKSPIILRYVNIKKYKLAAGKTAKSILVSCGARLAPFGIQELRGLAAYDEMELSWCAIP